MKCFLIQNCSIDADGMANTVVHVDVAKTLIELKLDVQRLTEMVLNLGIKVQAILHPKSWKSALR